MNTTQPSLSLHPRRICAVIPLLVGEEKTVVFSCLNTMSEKAHLPLPVAIIAENFRIDDSGLIWWTKPRPKVDLSKEAGTLSPCGYRQICIDGKRYKSHRVAWFLFTGEDPCSLKIDHINGVKDDNRRKNLRVVTELGNHIAYRKKTLGTSSVFRGVSFIRGYSKWLASIKIGGKQIHIGRFADEIEAANAYDKKARELGFANEALNFPSPH